LKIIDHKPNQITIEISKFEAELLRDAAAIVSPQDCYMRRLARDLEKQFDLILAGVI